MIEIPKWLELSTFNDSRGSLTVLDAQCLPFTPSRFFYSSVRNSGDERGGHSHKTCWQILFCLQGLIEVDCTWLGGSSSYTLIAGGSALIIPPGVWCKQIFRTSSSLLGAIASHPYDSSDYIYESP